MWVLICETVTYFELLQALPETRFTFYGPKALEIHVAPTKTATEFYQVKFLYTICINFIANSRTSFTIYLFYRKKWACFSHLHQGKIRFRSGKGCSLTVYSESNLTIQKGETIIIHLFIPISVLFT